MPAVGSAPSENALPPTAASRRSDSLDGTGLPPETTAPRWSLLGIAFVGVFSVLGLLTLWASVSNPMRFADRIPGDAVVLTSAERFSIPPGEASPGAQGTAALVTLPYHAADRRAELSRFRFQLEVPPSAGPQGICVPSWSASGSVHLDGQRLVSAPPGTLALHGRTKPSYVALPPGLSPGTHVLDIDIATPLGIATALSPVWSGDADLVRYACGTLQERYDMIRSGGIVLMLMLGLAAAAVTWLQRDRAAGWLAAMALAWGAHCLLVEGSWAIIGTDTWVALFFLTRGLGGLPMMMFCIRFTGLDAPRLERAVFALFIIAYGVFPLLPGSAWSTWMLAFGITLLCTLLPFMGILLRYSLSKGSIAGMVLSAAMLSVIGNNVIDLLRLVGLLPFAPRLAPYLNVTMLSLGLIALMVERLAGYLRAEAANAYSMRWELDQQRAQLNLDYQLLTAQQQRIAVLEERRRILREMHDGLGTQLVSASALARSASGSTASPLRAVIDAALMDFRSVLDVLSNRSMASRLEDSPVSLLLAQLRHRMEPTLRAGGIELEWDVDAIPQSFLADQALKLELLRLLQEAFANVIKHSGASNVRFSAHVQDRELVLEVTDNGCGIVTGAPHDRAAGHGMLSMRRRAAQLGARLEIGDAQPGTRISLRFPVDPASATDAQAD